MSGPKHRIGFALVFLGMVIFTFLLNAGVIPPRGSTTGKRRLLQDHSEFTYPSHWIPMRGVESWRGTGGSEAWLEGIYPSPSYAFAAHNSYWSSGRMFYRKPSIFCTHDPEDIEAFESSANQPRVSSYILINEPRTGSSWLQEISNMHPGVKVQFELDLRHGDDALTCKQCYRPKVPNTKHPQRTPAKFHPPQACGMTIFGRTNDFNSVRDLAERKNASLIILIRRNHVAHAISEYRHFRKSPWAGPSVPWDAAELSRKVGEMQASYEKLFSFPSQTGRRSLVIFYEDMEKNPGLVWAHMQEFLGITVSDVKHIEGLEHKSTSKPSVEYLSQLAHINNMVAAAAPGGWESVLAPMLNPNFSSEIDLEAEFSSFCARALKNFPDLDLSWRKGRCDKKLHSEPSPL